jgi:ribonuclease E
MENQKNQRLIEEQLKNLSLIDRARIQIGRISRFGLLEFSRQRLRGVLGESSNITCPRCSGIGHIRSVESSALHILRAMEEESMKDGTVSIQAQVPLTVATYLLNEKRVEIRYLEKRLGVTCILIPNTNLETPNYTIKRVKSDDVENSETPSYKILKTIENETSTSTSTNKNQGNLKPIVTVVNPEKAPTSRFSIISFIKNLFSPKKSNKKNSKFTNKRNYLKSKRLNRKKENYQSKNYNNSKRKFNSKRGFKKSNKSSPQKTKSDYEINVETKTQTLESKKDVSHVKQNNLAINEINTLIEATSNDFDNSIKELSNKASINNNDVEKNKSLSEEKVNYKDEVQKSGLEMIETKEK